LACDKIDRGFIRTNCMSRGQIHHQ